MPYTARVLRVDLSAGTSSVEEIAPEVLRTWIGGSGLGVHYLMQEVPPGVAWDDPENRVFIFSGPLGNTRPYIADNAKLNELVKPLFQDAKEFGGGSLYNWGTAGGVSGAARGGWLPIKNYTTSVFEEHEQVSGQYLRGKFEWKTNPC